MKRLLHFVLALLAGSFTTQAQMLENVDFENGNNTINTYLTGINNKGFVTGYMTENSVEYGFIISPTGNVVQISPSDLGTTNVRVEGINDNNVSIVVGQTGTNTTVYKCYYNVAKDTISHLVQVTMSQPNALPLDINNKNDISGWYAGSQNWLFVKHDSIVPTGNTAWMAKRVPDILPNYFSTTGGGINDNNNVSGWYIDGSNIAAMVYDNIAHTFNQLNSIYRVKLWDINNNNIVCGEYRQTNGTYMGFYGTPGSGSILNFTSLNTIFQTNTIQSVATGVNDNMDIVGNYLNPNTGRWNGFIYHPNVPEYRLPGGFTVANDTWPMINSHAGTNPIWTNNYYQGASYATQDPYANNGEPLITPNIVNTHNITTLPDAMSPTWKGYATECDITGSGVSTNPQEQEYYRTLHKPALFDKWYSMVSQTFKGYCYGFTNTSLQRFYEDATFSSWFNMPAGSNISQIGNTDLTAVMAIERTQLKQQDKGVLKKNRRGQWLWAGLYRTKLEFMKTAAQTNPSDLAIQLNANDWHSILPYKIRTPRTLPFSQRDTIYYYDPNDPTDSTNYIKVGSIYYLMQNNSTGMSCATYPGLRYMLFRYTGIRDINTVQHTQMKSTAGPAYDEMYTFSLPVDCYYNITMNGNTEAKVDVNGYTNDSLHITPILRYNQQTPVNEHVVDTTVTVNLSTFNYPNNVMVWNQVNNSRSMGISRAAQSTETDNSTQKNRMITYGNPDNVNKTLTAFMRETETAMQQGVNIVVSNICAAPGDSIVTSSPSTYVFNVTKVNGSNNCTYNLDIYAAYNGVINEFHSAATIEPNSSHTIDPYFNNGNGDQIAVIVDNGQDGIPDDTLFVTGFPLDMKAPLHNINIRVYPNPVSDLLSLEFGNIHDAYNVNLTDVVGKNVYSSAVSRQDNKLEIPMERYPAGIYMLRVTDGKGNLMYVDKIVKQ